jgi:hypothetical protein
VVLFPDIPAALSGLTNEQRTSFERKTHSPIEMREIESAGRLPCNLCLVKVSPLKVDSWLAQLEETASEGDLEKLQEQILGLRSQLRGDVSVQARANLSDEER